MPYDIDNPMILTAYTITRGPSLDDDYDETRHEDEAFARRVRNRQEEHPAIDAYEERQIKRAMGGKCNVNSRTETNRTEQGNDIRGMAG